MSDITLTDEELERITGYKLPARELAELHKQGFYRARMGRDGKVILERAHYETVQARRVDEEKAARLAVLMCAEPPIPRKYDGSPLQRYHQEQRAQTEEREAARRRFQEDHADLLASRKAHQQAVAKLERAALVLFHANKRRAAKISRTPAWADLDAIRAIYAKAASLSEETGVPHHVDHVFPLQGRLVSGLHVDSNLQILLGGDNVKKSNHFEPE